MLFVDDFKRFLAKRAPGLPILVEPIASTKSFKDAQESVGPGPQAFRGYLERLRILKDPFLNGGAFEMVWKQSARTARIRL
jgi:hypothetical protein